MIKINQITIPNIFAYIQGNIRYMLFYSRFKFLIRRHIREQIDARIYSMDSVCYNQGSCKLCGCSTTALQMANKACDKPCYPKMLSRKKWKHFKKHHLYTEETKNEILYWNLDDKLFTLIKRHEF